MAGVSECRPARISGSSRPFARSNVKPSCFQLETLPSITGKPFSFDTPLPSDMRRLLGYSQRLNLAVYHKSSCQLPITCWSFGLDNP